MKVGIYTLGCKVNTYESEYVISLLEEKGYTISSFDDICDIYIINTCTVTNQSDSKSRKIINQAIRRNTDACVVAMGCFIEANKDIKIDGVDIYIGNKDKSKIVDLIEEWFRKREEIRNLYFDLGTTFEDMEIKKIKEHTRAFVKIQDGCENFCTYCIIPYVRGKCRSKDKSTVIKEITELVNNGYKEIVLTGIHTSNYGADLDYSFADLLEELVKIEGLKHLRISSIEITELNDRVLELIKNNSIICNHLHIPLQAGSNHVLKMMNRKYDLEYFQNKIEIIRNIRPDISISTDIIVGFPGETEEDFNSTLIFSKQIGFSKIHAFPYSVRYGTAASKFPNQLDGTLKKERNHKLIELSNKLEIEYMNKFINKEVEVLVEKNIDGYSYGHTSNYLLVKIEGDYLPNTFVKVKINEISYPYCLALEEISIKM